MAQPIQSLEMESGEFGPAGEETAPTEISPSLIDQLVGKALAPETPTEPTDKYLDEVDTRLEVATYYRELLKAPLFSAATEASMIVEKEIRDFTHNRLKILFGITPKVEQIVKSPFNELETATLHELGNLKPIEITTLKMILAQVLKSTGAAEKVEPSVNAAKAPEAKPTPAIAPRQMPAAPSRPPATQPSAAPAKRGPGRPPKETITVIDPVTNQPRELKVTKEQIKNNRGIPMPTGSGLYAATMRASERSVGNMENKPEAVQVLRATGN